eukprot:scaffold3245_cov57-Phaeocystis_antarctica.AAC.2
MGEERHVRAVWRDRANAQARRDAGDPHEKEKTEEHLRLYLVPCRDVDDAEEDADRRYDEYAGHVLQWVVEGEVELAAQHHHRLIACTNGAWLEYDGGHADGRRLGFTFTRSLPRIEHSGDGLAGGDVLGDEFKHGLGRVGCRTAVAVLGMERLADGGKVWPHAVTLAVVGHAPLRENEHLVEGREDGGRRLVDGAHDGSRALGSD